MSRILVCFLPGLVSWCRWALTLRNSAKEVWMLSHAGRLVKTGPSRDPPQKHVTQEF